MSEIQENPFRTLSESILDGFKARFTDPFLGTYTVLFLSWNYQIFLYAFSDLSPDTKYVSIQNSLNLLSFFVPAILTPVLLIILPISLLKVHRLHEKTKIDLENIRDDAKLSKKTVAQAIAWLESRVREETDRALKLQNIGSDKDQEIGRLKQQTDTIQKDMLEYKSSTINLQNLNQKNESERLKLADENKRLKIEIVDLKARATSQEPTVHTSPEAQKVIQNLDKSESTSLFMDIASEAILKDIYVHAYDSSFIVKIKSLGLIDLENDNYNGKIIRLTNLGQEVLQHLVTQ